MRLLGLVWYVGWLGVIAFLVCRRCHVPFVCLFLCADVVVFVCVACVLRFV